jgi:hypothetical protein
MTDQVFLRMAKEAFVPFLKELGFVMDEPSISGRFYCVDFNSARHQVSVSYEPGDNAFFVMVGESRNGQFVDIDDTAKTQRLTDLNNRYMATVSNDERAENEAVFESVAAHDGQERLLLKAAKELRLVLRKYLASQKCGL